MGGLHLQSVWEEVYNSCRQMSQEFVLAIKYLVCQIDIC